MKGAYGRQRRTRLGFLRPLAGRNYVTEDWPTRRPCKSVALCPVEGASLNHQEDRLSGDAQLPPDPPHVRCDKKQESVPRAPISLNHGAEAPKDSVRQGPICRVERAGRRAATNSQQASRRARLARLCRTRVHVPCMLCMWRQASVECGGVCATWAFEMASNQSAAPARDPQYRLPHTDPQPRLSLQCSSEP